jgi:ferredoxin
MNFYQFRFYEILIAERKIKIMADKNLKNSENAAGRFYVDSSCIDCDLCRSTAPKFFKRHDEGGYSYVYRQPQTPEELAEAEEARGLCPTDTIGNDGE